MDKTARLFDAGTGRPVASLGGHEWFVLGGRFRNAGQEIATVATDHTTRVTLRRWPVHPLAAGLARKPRDLTFEERKQHAILRPEDLEPEKLLEPLFVEHLIVEDVIAHLRQDKTLSTTVRDIAIQMARFRGDSDEFESQAREILRRPGASREQYLEALRRARAACRLAPGHAGALLLLGAAQYRLASYAEALDALTRCEKTRACGSEPSLPEDIAFLAMTYHRLGRPEDARTSLARLRKLMEKPANAKTKDNEALLKEVEELLAK